MDPMGIKVDYGGKKHTWAQTNEISESNMIVTPKYALWEYIVYTVSIQIDLYLSRI